MYLISNLSPMFVKFLLPFVEIKIMLRKCKQYFFVGSSNYNFNTSQAENTLAC